MERVSDCRIVVNDIYDRLRHDKLTPYQGDVVADVGAHDLTPMLTVSVETQRVAFLYIATLVNIAIRVARIRWTNTAAASNGRNAQSIATILIKNGRLEFGAVGNLDVAAVPDRDCTAICQPSKRTADSFQRYAHIGADIGTFHRQIYLL